MLLHQIPKNMPTEINQQYRELIFRQTGQRLSVNQADEQMFLILLFLKIWSELAKSIE